MYIHIYLQVWNERLIEKKQKDCGYSFIPSSNNSVFYLSPSFKLAQFFEYEIGNKFIVWSTTWFN